MEYKEIGELGAGGFGVVSLVQCEEGKEWAKKTYRTPLSLDPEKDQKLIEQFLKRFRKEVGYQRQINHPNVAKIVDANLEVTPPFYIMPVAQGTLEEDLNQDKTLGGDPDRVREVLFNILSGLQALHEQGIYHRDLKPSNILKYVDNDDSTRYVLSDFGLAANENGNSTTLTASGDRGGTENYAPPEFTHSLNKATARSDIYSFGAILHDIFGNDRRVPYTELSVPDPLLSAIVSKCTKTQPKRRYKNTEEIREELYIALNGSIEFHSTEEEGIINLLKKEEDLTDQEWDEVYEFIDENHNILPEKNHEIYKYINIEQLVQLNRSAPEIFEAVGNMFCQYITEKQYHNFDYCDVLGDKLQAFYDHGDLALKTNVVLTCLDLGTSHNRWYVERKFVRMVSPEIDDILAKRILIEIKASSPEEFLSKKARLEDSIELEMGYLHPMLENVS